MVSIMLGALPLLAQFGVPFNISELLILWFESEGIEDIDALFSQDENQAMMQQIAMAQQAQALMGDGSQGAPAGPGWGGTPTGEPRPQTSQPPADLIAPENSGMMGPSY